MAHWSRIAVSVTVFLVVMVVMVMMIIGMMGVIIVGEMMRVINRVFVPVAQVKMLHSVVLVIA